MNSLRVNVVFYLLIFRSIYNFTGHTTKPLTSLQINIHDRRINKFSNYDINATSSIDKVVSFSFNILNFSCYYSNSVLI